MVTIWGDAFEGRLYGYYDTFKTLNGEFEELVIMSSKAIKPEDALSKLDADFEQFKKDNPQYKKLILYRTSKYYNVEPWMFWKWYRYAGLGRSEVIKYPYVDTNLQ